MTFEIVQIIQELSTAGGAETVAIELARSFCRAGITNTVIASTVAAEPQVQSAIDRAAPWLARIPTRGPLRYLGRLLVVPLFTIAATLGLRRHRRATVISHGDSLKGDVLVVHAVNSASLAEKRRAGQWMWLLNPLHLWVALRDRWMIAGLRYRMFVAVSDRVSKELQHYYHVPPARIRIIPNGIDLDRFSQDRAAGEAVRREFGIPDGARLLLFAGHEFSRKGLAPAIGALALLGPDTWLLVVGSDSPGPYRRLAGPDAGRVVFAGSRSDMPALYSAADAFVLPTSYETFSLVCMEAMACSVPVFATRAGGIEDYLVDGVNGFGITADAADIADKVGWAFADPALVARLRTGARATAQGFGWDRVAAQYIELMEQMATTKAGGPPAAPRRSGLDRRRSERKTAPFGRRQAGAPADRTAASVVPDGQAAPS